MMVGMPSYIGGYGPLCIECNNKLLTQRLEFPVGWECPRCHNINAPYIKQCECSAETTNFIREEIVIDFNKFKNLEELISELYKCGIEVRNSGLKTETFTDN